MSLVQILTCLSNDPVNTLWKERHKERDREKETKKKTERDRETEREREKRSDVIN